MLKRRQMNCDHTAHLSPEDAGALTAHWNQKVRGGPDSPMYCTKKMVMERPDLMGHFTTANHLSNGVLPYPGGLKDQPAKAMELAHLILSARQDAREKQERLDKWRKGR